MMPDWKATRGPSDPYDFSDTDPERSKKRAAVFLACIVAGAFIIAGGVIADLAGWW